MININNYQEFRIAWLAAPLLKNIKPPSENRVKSFFGGGFQECLEFYIVTENFKLEKITKRC